MKHSDGLPEKKKYAHLSWSPKQVQRLANTKLQNAKHKTTLVNTQSLETDRWKDRHTDRQTCSHKIAQAVNTYKKKNK